MDSVQSLARELDDQPAQPAQMSQAELLSLILSKMLEAMPDKCAVLEARLVPAGLVGISCEIDAAGSPEAHRLIR